MADLKNTFIQGVMNKDLDERLVPQGQYRDALNITVETSEGSNVGAAQNSLGNTSVPNNLDTKTGYPNDNSRCIGAVVYEAANKIYFFISSDSYDGIYEYDANEEEMRRVLQCTKNPTSTLNFRKEYAITGVNHIVGADGNTFLYWTDDYNPPRRVNISRVISDPDGIGGYSIDDPRIEYDIDVILEPPMYSPHIELSVDETDPEANNMKEKFLFFAYRYQYVDNQYSSLSPFSAVAFAPDEYEYDYGVGNNKSMTNAYNQVKISFETGNEFVKAVQLVVRDTRNLNVGIIDTYTKDELTSYSQLGDSATLTFKNNKILAALPTDQVTRLFDNVPLLAKAQDVIGNRLAYGNYLQFRDIVDCTGDEIKIDYTLNVKTSDTATPSTPKPTWHSDRDYEFALLYTDGYGRMTTALTCDTNSVYVRPELSTTANQIVMTINSKPPCWATHYRIAVKESKTKVYNIFPVLYYVSGSYRYFLINQSDVNKLKVGEYVIFKSDNDGSTQTNKKYKVLEVETKTAGFISGGISELGGVYFKIKVDFSNEFPANAVTNYVYESNGIGPNANSNAPLYPNPVTSRFSTVEQPIHYGQGDPNGISTHSYVPNFGFTDTRFTIEILSNTTFQYTSQIDASSGWTQGTIIQGTETQLLRSGLHIASIVFNSNNYVVGDRWKVNARGLNHFNGNYFGGVGLPNGQYGEGDYGGGVIVNNGFTSPILPGSVVRMQMIQDLEGSPYTSEQIFPQSQSYYQNIEEWFVESGAYTLFQQYNKEGEPILNSQGVTFRRGLSVDSNSFAQFSWESITQGSGTDPMYMIVQGYGYGEGEINEVKFKLSISQLDATVICETSPKDKDAEIYHELSQTYPIENGWHAVNWPFTASEAVVTGPFAGKTRLKLTDKSRPHYFTVGDSVEVDGTDYDVLATRDRYQITIDKNWTGAVTPGGVKLTGSDNQDQTNAFVPAIIEINNPDNYNCDYNAWTWGNGLESDRIYDDFNDTTLEFSPRATTVIENYKQIRNDASICYSGIYNENTQYNRLNEFNLSLSNFKYLDREFGSIQKLHARDSDLIAFQENKVSTVQYEKNVLYDAVGGGQVVSIPEVLGGQIPFTGEYGISKNPESFAQWGNQIFFTDARRGVVLGVTTTEIGSRDQLFEISSFGMRDYFRDLMVDNPITQKLGAYDPHNHNYVLANTTQRAIPCTLSISRTELKVPKNGPVGYFLFRITTDAAWTITLINAGFGTNWLSDVPTSGIGSQDIYGSVAANLTASNRSVDVRITYCDGLIKTFTLRQAKGKSGTLVSVVLNSKAQ